MNLYEKFMNFVWWHLSEEDAETMLWEKAINRSFQKYEKSEPEPGKDHFWERIKRNEAIDKRYPKARKPEVENPYVTRRPQEYYDSLPDRR